MGRLRPDVAALVARANAAPAFNAATFDPGITRTLLRSSSALADLPRPQSVTVRDHTIAGLSGIPLSLRLYWPPEPGTATDVIVFFHGGGWVMGDLDTHDGLCGAICEGMGLRLVAVEYRRAPEHPFPAALEDCRAAVQWAAEGPELLGPVSALVLAGDSAGGNMAASVALSSGSSGDLATQVVAFWTMYASFDMDAEGGSMDELAEGYLLTAEMLALFRRAYFVKATDRRRPDASPLLADLSRAPAALIFANECDPLRDQSRAFAARLAEAGRPVRFREAKGHVHGSLCRRAAAPSGQVDLAGCMNDLRALLVEARVEAERRHEQV